ncbi:MAG: CapA family protein, partial [Gemmatimonadota bacterium]
IDACILANNHVLDWGRAGLVETVETLTAAGIAIAGAGRNTDTASSPAVLDTPGGRVRVHAWGLPSAGVPMSWAPEQDQPGVAVLRELDAGALRRVAASVAAAREPGDRAVVSLHWGGNWGYDVPSDQRRFAHELIDAGAADVVFGHSSHHPKGLEVYRDRLILYGAGDFLNDYEGIGGREAFRGDLTLMYFPVLAPSGALRRLRMTPMRIRRFRLERADEEEAAWLARTLDRESRPFGARVELSGDGRLELA